MLEDNEYVEIEGRQYGSPQLIIDESNQFIDNLRATQQANTQQIAEQTANLGTEIPSSLGGLAGGESYWTARLSTPATNATVANLRATAQAAALNQALANEQAMWQKRYQDAYKSYQRRAASNAARAASGSTGGTSGGVQETSTKLTGKDRMILDESDLQEGGAFIVEPGSGNIVGEGFSGTNPRYVLQQDGSYKKYSPSTSQSGSIDIFELVPNLITNYKKTTGKSSSKAGFSGR